MSEALREIYRCGWCGWPCGQDGHPIGFGRLDADEYLRKNASATVVKVNGNCCPNGDGS